MLPGQRAQQPAQQPQADPCRAPIQTVAVYQDLLCIRDFLASKPDLQTLGWVARALQAVEIVKALRTFLKAGQELFKG